MNQNPTWTHLKSCFTITIFFVLLARRATSVADPRFLACRDDPNSCDDGKTIIKFPFFIKHLRQPFCGHPGYELSCNENRQTILKLPGNDDYIVHKISYDNQTLRVSNRAFSNLCDAPIHNLTLLSKHYQLDPETTNAILLLNCTAKLQGDILRYSIGCSSVGDDNYNNGVVLALSGNDSKRVRAASKKCGGFVVAPVDGGGEGVGETVMKRLRSGFVLKWKESDCSECQGSGGECGFDLGSHHFQCFCPDRPRAKHCSSSSAQGTKQKPQDCPKSFTCGKLGNLGYPFTNYSCPRPGRLNISGCHGNTSIHLKDGGRGFRVENISQSDIIRINDPVLEHLLHSKNCCYFEGLSLPETPFYSLHIIKNLTMFKCSHSSPSPSWENSLRVDCSLQRYTIYYNHQLNDSTALPPHCSIIQLPSYHPPPKAKPTDLFTLLSPQFSLQVQINADCLSCHHFGGECQHHGCYLLGSYCKHDSKGKFHCTKGNGSSGLKLGLGLGLGLGIGCACIVGMCLFLWRCNKQKHASSEYKTRSTCSDPSTAELEEGTVHNGVHIFLYSELEEATNHFNESNEIGDGGFGAVYYGKLKDGREVAVKRLYEHNYRRLHQFINETRILTRLRHKNLVSLYGCTSRRSRELLLVYEFIPNGTLAYHLHGEGSKGGSSMAWPIRMSTAIETASALAYLHASDIIHRDVKTDNILLDNNYCVKVADFGLSRLFPVDVTHVSTAPQGTPGYVDPEYHQCYQLTDKSDVYSFGVVLVELISSMPAVDITRHRHNINLANLALNRIQEGAFTELVDPNLGFDSDDGTRTMILLVAELAFRCLQQDNEIRPDMEEVLETLKMIQGGGSTASTFGRVSCTERSGKDSRVIKTEIPPRSPGCCDKIGLLKNAQVVVPPASPDSVTDRWLSSSSTKTNPSM